MPFNTSLFLARLTLMAKGMKNAVEDTKETVHTDETEAPQNNSIDLTGKLDFIDQACEKFFDRMEILVIRAIQAEEGDYAKEALAQFKKNLIDSIDNATDITEEFLQKQANSIKSEYELLKAEYEKHFGKLEQ